MIIGSNAANEERPEGVSVRFALIGRASRHINAHSSFAAIGRSEATAYRLNSAAACTPSAGMSCYLLLRAYMVAVLIVSVPGKCSIWVRFLSPTFTYLPFHIFVGAFQCIFYRFIFICHLYASDVFFRKFVLTAEMTSFYSFRSNENQAVRLIDTV